VNDLRDVLDDAQVRQRGSLVEISGDWGTVTVPAPMPSMSGARREPTPAPALGADRAAVLADWVG